MVPAEGQEDRDAWEPDGEQCPRRYYDVKGRGAVSEESIQRATERATKAMLVGFTLPSPHKVPKSWHIC